MGFILVLECDLNTCFFANFSEFGNDFFFFIGSNLKFSLDDVLIEELNLLSNFLERIAQWLRFLVLQVKILLHLNFVRVLARLVGIVVEIFGLEEHVASHQLVQIIVQFSVIGMSAPGDESTLLGKNGVRQAWALKVHQQVLALLIGVVELAVFTLLFDEQVVVSQVMVFCRSTFHETGEALLRIIRSSLIDDGNGDDLVVAIRFVDYRPSGFFLLVIFFIFWHRFTARLVLFTSTVNLSGYFCE